MSAQGREDTGNAHDDLVQLAAAARSGNLPHTDPAWQLRELDPATARHAAVLMLFGVLDEVDAQAVPQTTDRVPADLDVLLIERAADLVDHPGQVSFPGGSIDAQDSSHEAAALREAVEETGLEPAGVEILGALPEVGLPVTNFLVTPVLAWWSAPSPVAVVDFGESAQVFRVPVRDLLDPANRRTTILQRQGHTFRGPCFTINGLVVWGFTAMLLNQLFDQLGWTVPWDRSVEIPAPV